MSTRKQRTASDIEHLAYVRNGSKADIAPADGCSHVRPKRGGQLAKGNYFSRRVTFALGGALLISAVAVNIASQASMGKRPQPRIIEVDCVNVERGPTLRFDNGLLKANSAVVGTYTFEPAMPGKYGPRIRVEGTRLRQSGNTIVIEAGREQWFWPYVDENTVKIYFYPQNGALAHRCNA